MSCLPLRECCCANTLQCCQFQPKEETRVQMGNNADVNHGGLTVSESDCNATSQVHDCSANFNVSSIADNEPALGEPV